MICYRPLVWFIVCVVHVRAACNRKPIGASGDRSLVDQNYQILIDGNPPTYIPGQQYNISLSCPINMKFISFTLALESDVSNENAPMELLGRFKVFDGADTRFSSSCENMVESTNTNVKTRIDVGWLAPTNPESGCVLIKAGVLQHRNVWFIDDGFLTKRICPEEIDEINTLTRPLEQCCACDEAKYEITLERKWARNTHAKDFPSEAWRTRLSDIIGASHTYDYRFWQYGASASRGFRELAEHGATQTLEEEIIENTRNGNIRTIIKAPGIAYRQNVLGTTLANARLDSKHHLISLVSKIEPSPDWILGVAGLELCLSNCTWIERKVLNLYPWDAGSDSGPSYMSPDEEQVPPDVIRRITSTYPSDTRSPFFDNSGAPMKPLATLYVTRKKLYLRECEEVDGAPLECATHPWNAWSDCSMRCGPGTQSRMRFYKNAALADSYKCERELKEERNCMGEQCGAADEKSDAAGSTAECELTLWSQWSSCSKRCGKGYSKRTRDYRNPYARERCQAGVFTALEDSRDCVGNDCGGTIPGNFNANDDDADDFAHTNLFEEHSPNFEQTPKSSWNPYEAKNRPQYVDSRNRFSAAEDSPTNNYGNRLPEDRYKQDYGIVRTQRPAYNANEPLPGNEDVSTPQEHIYGSEKLIGHGHNPSNNENSNFAIRFNSNQYARPNKYNYAGQQQQQQQEQQTARFPVYNAPGVGDRAGRPDYGGGIRESYNVDGQKAIIAEGTAADNYNIVQEYCFQKPYASRRPCNAKTVKYSNFWFYDADDRECKIFTANNCDENRNKFRTLEACEGTCHRPQENLEETQDTNVAGELWGGRGGGVAAGNEGLGEPQAQVRAGGVSNRRKYNKYRY